jgi:hypothetical protein
MLILPNPKFLCRFLLKKRIKAKKTKLENPRCLLQAKWWRTGGKSLLQANRQRASSKLSQELLVFAAKVCFKRTGSERLLQANRQQTGILLGGLRHVSANPHAKEA